MAVMKNKDEYTKYEKTRIISARALQIAQGSPVLIRIPKSITDPTEIAKLEWDAGVIPIDIKSDEEAPKTTEEDNQPNEEKRK